ncbi:hypothetical protein O5O45_20600 [Hahella aquimaris]|uniref:hypothetical protein n=1 Tax=Hahella sp. HNIBRBA332 TaxID=3015983 RepID=UPI00273B7D82|nr:hypothetical protein [Hahella sp. HNIBRBA332]WLQ12128.1 hypothetical protein O5O45_20600 [Hahella sp. HNIBRBA332]
MQPYPFLRALALFALSILALVPIILLFTYAFVELGLLFGAILCSALSAHYYSKASGESLSNAKLGAFAVLGAGYCLLLEAGAYFIFQTPEQALSSERLIAYGLTAYLTYLIAIILCASVVKPTDRQNKPARLIPHTLIDRWIERLSKPLDTLSNDELILKIAGSPSGGIKGFILGAAFMWLLINTLVYPLSPHISAIISMLLLSFLALLLITTLSKRNLLLEEMRKRLNSEPDSASSEPSSTQYTQ